MAFLWNFWWFRHAGADPDISFFFSGHLFAPYGSSLVLHTHTALQAAVGATVAGAAPLVAAHNLVLLAGLAANGVFTYALAHHQVRRVLPAVLAGTIFAASTFISIRLLGHFNLVHAWVLPLALLAWVRWIERPSAARAVAVALAAAAAAYTDYYYLVFAAVAAVLWWAFTRWDVGIVRVQRPAGVLATLLAALMLALIVLIAAILVTGGFRIEVGSLRLSATNIRNPLAALCAIALLAVLLRRRVVVRAAADRGTHPESRGRWRASAIGAAVVVLVALLPLGLAARELVSSGDYASPPRVWRSGPRGIDLLTLVAGNPLNPVSGGLTRAVYSQTGINLMEQCAWVGIVPLLVLTIAGVRGALRGPTARRWWILTFAFLIWAVGGYVLAAGIDTAVPMPQILARLVPVLSNARMPGRAMVMVQLAVAVLSAIAVTRLEWRGPVLAGLIVVSVADGSAAPIALYELPAAGGVDSALGAAGPTTTVVELPTGLRDGFGETGRFDHRALVHQTFHERPLAGGFVARLSPRVREAYAGTPALAALVELSGQRDVEAVNGLPTDLAAGLLAAGVTHVVVNTDALPFSMREALESRGFRLIVEEDGRELYTVKGGS